MVVAADTEAAEEARHKGWKAAAAKEARRKEEKEAAATARQ